MLRQCDDAPATCSRAHSNAITVADYYIIGVIIAIDMNRLRAFEFAQYGRFIDNLTIDSFCITYQPQNIIYT